jgi:hypothetical protein
MQNEPVLFFYYITPEGHFADIITKHKVKLDSIRLLKFIANDLQNDVNYKNGVKACHAITIGTTLNYESDGKKYKLCRIPCIIPENHIKYYKMINVFSLNNKMRRLMNFVFSNENIKISEDYCCLDSFTDLEDESMPTQKSDVLIQTPIIELTQEMRNNMNMLKKINFISNNDHIIWEDRIILKVPCVYAYGDFLTNRDSWYESNDKTQGMMIRISRINSKDIRSLNWGYTDVSKKALMKYPWMVLMK